MSKTETKKIRALKVAPWWKRLIAYTIDSVFLLIILTLFIAGIYGEELVLLLDNITKYGGLNLIMEEQSFSNEALNQVSGLTPQEQNITYWIHTVQNKYAYSIFILNQIISILYFALFWWSTGQTLGAKILKIKVISPLKTKLSVLSVSSRVIALKLIEMAWGLPALIVTNPLLKQRLHDSLSNTVVVEEFSEDDEEEEITKKIEESTPL